MVVLGGGDEVLLGVLVVGRIKGFLGGELGLVLHFRLGLVVLHFLLSVVFVLCCFGSLWLNSLGFTVHCRLIREIIVL